MASAVTPEQSVTRMMTDPKLKRILDSTFVLAQAMTMWSSFPTSCVKKINDSVYQLYSPKQKSCNVEIVFFHGVQREESREEHIDTWKSKGVCWPQKWLPKVFRRARVLTVGYDASLVQKQEQGRSDLDLISERVSIDLLLAEVGRSSCPVLLVGHSLGGLVIENICTQMVEKGVGKWLGAPEFTKNLKAIFLYDTPHAGMKTSHPDSLEKPSPLCPLLEFLSCSAARIADRFQYSRRINNWTLYSVSAAHEKGGEKLVPEASARGAFADVFYTAPYADHQSVCKPADETDSCFQLLKHLITDLLENDSKEQKRSLSQALTLSKHGHRHGDVRVLKQDDCVTPRVPRFGLSLRSTQTVSVSWITTFTNYIVRVRQVHLRQVRLLKDKSRQQVDHPTQAVRANRLTLTEIEEGDHGAGLDRVSTERGCEQQVNHPRARPAVLPHGLSLPKDGGVGLHERSEEVIDLLQRKSPNQVRVAIVGIEGLGKATLAKAVFSKIWESFEYTCFVDTKRTNGMCTQSIILDNFFCGYKKVSVADWGSLTGKKVLLVLANVTSKEQIEAVPREMFNADGESRLMITSSCKNRPLCIQPVDFAVYDMKPLQFEQAKELFSKYAVPSNVPQIVVSEIVKRCEGIPLALEYMGNICNSLEDKYDWSPALAMQVKPPALTQKKRKSFSKLRESFKQIPLFLKGAELLRRQNDIFLMCQYVYSPRTSSPPSYVLTS